MGWDISATLPAPHLTVEERKYWDWNDMLFVKCIGFIVGIFLMLEGEKWKKYSSSLLENLDHNGNHILNNRREALLRIEEAAAKGQSPISPDYAPDDKVETMVPPAGDWEKIWLARQPTTMVRGSTKWMW